MTTTNTTKTVTRREVGLALSKSFARSESGKTTIKGWGTATRGYQTRQDKIGNMLSDVHVYWEAGAFATNYREQLEKMQAHLEAAGFTVVYVDHEMLHFSHLVVTK